MSLSRRYLALFGKIVAVAALVCTGLQPAIPQARGKGPQAARPAGALALRAGQEITFTSPQFVVHALWYKANDETGWAWTGSDEVYAVFADMDPTHADRVTSVTNNVDEGDTINFSGDNACMAPQTKCDRGMSELNVRFALWESDYWKYFDFCPGTFPGDHTILQGGRCSGDDLIGRGEIIYSRDDLVAMLPTVGDSREFTHVMDKDAGTYRLRYRITRLANIERSIVVHLPPLDPRPPITLQATALITSQGRTVRLTWTGATGASVDIRRNNSVVATTANDGMHDDGPVLNGTYQYLVCNQGSTTACSSQVQVVVNL